MDKKTRIFFTIIFLFILSFFLLIISTLFGIKRSPRNITPLPIPTSVEQLKPSITFSVPLSIISITPPEDKTGEKNYSPNQPITFFFNKEIDPGKFIVEITPQRQLSMQFGASPKEVIITPDSPLFWEPDITYTIIIKRGTTAIDGTQLGRDINYKIRVRPPKAGE